MLKTGLSLAPTLTLALLLGASPAAAERLAFVAGVADYTSTPLDVPGNRTANNASDVGAALTLSGWRVNLGVDENREQFLARLAAFLRTVGGDDTVLFYYSGHGAYIDANNWLLLRDVVPPQKMSDTQWAIELLRSSVLLPNVTAELEAAGARDLVVIVDAPRTAPNPVLDAIGPGIAPQTGPEHSFILFASSPGAEALLCLTNDPTCLGDPGRNSVFTRALLPRLTQPGLAIGDLANQLVAEVPADASRAGLNQQPVFFDRLDQAQPDPELGPQSLGTLGQPTTTVLLDQQLRGGLAAENYGFAPPAPLPSYNAQPFYVPGYSLPEPSNDRFTEFDDGRVVVVADSPVSTFSIDVDTASYAFVRSSLETGVLPPRDAVRVEEMINYFSYDYPAPDSTATPFATSVAVYPTPWNPATQLLHIGIKGYEPSIETDVASNLVFLIDTSGSMDSPDKLPLLKRSFSLLVDQLTANDTVSIVVYAGSAGLVLEPTSGADKAKILAALDGLAAGGSTAGASGIQLAYQVAERARVSDGINRVILATDGDFNVGISDPNQLRTFIRTKRDSGVSLSVLGFGEGNYNDAIMQSLAQNGNGNASYIDSFREAQKVLVEEVGGTLQTIASDVKIQIEFNPAVVAEYRLIGYETRALNREDFNNDRIDAGEIGAGHTVTAIYEITPVGSAGAMVDPLRYGTNPATVQADPTAEIAFLKLRYKLPGEADSTLMEIPVGPGLVADSLTSVSDDIRFAAAVAAFGQKLRGGDVGADMSYGDIRSLAQGARGADEGGYRAEFISLVGLAQSLDH